MGVFEEFYAIHVVYWSVHLADVLLIKRKVVGLESTLFIQYPLVMDIMNISLVYLLKQTGQVTY